LVLEDIFAHVQPVFRHYFFDRSSTAPGWFQRRLAYTRSVAASSVAGFVVGLGDRHTNNVLVLESTGEVVHIDLGVVFDQVSL
jgi:ataxia telangiectasia mutated family protein